MYRSIDVIEYFLLAMSTSNNSSSLPPNHNPTGTLDPSNPSYGTCSNCSAPILDKKSAFCVKNELYHQSCLKCSICQVILTTHLFFLLDGKFYCDADFSIVAVRCLICENPIRERQVTNIIHYK